MNALVVPNEMMAMVRMEKRRVIVAVVVLRFGGCKEVIYCCYRSSEMMLATT